MMSLNRNIHFDAHLDTANIMGRSVSISIIVPVYNDPNNLLECLSTLTTLSHPSFEIIVVDDGSTDDISSVSDKPGVRVLTLARNSGPAAARNHGARHARGNIIFFVDADVIVAPDALQRVEKVFEERPEITAVFGSYDATPRATGIISQYRNLLHHYVHQNGNPDASTFWAGCGAIRKTVFDEIGGFDNQRFVRPSIEDVELGYRLRRAGYRILLDKGLQATHLKRWTMLSFLKTDILCRAIPWSRLILESKSMPNDLNLKWDQRVCFVLVVFVCIFLVLGAFQIESLAISAAGLLGVFSINRRMYLFFYRQRGISFALACFPLHLLYYLYSGLTFLYVRLLFTLRGSSTSA